MEKEKLLVEILIKDVSFVIADINEEQLELKI